MAGAVLWLRGTISYQVMNVPAAGRPRPGIVRARAGRAAAGFPPWPSCNSGRAAARLSRSAGNPRLLEDDGRRRPAAGLALSASLRLRWHQGSSRCRLCFSSKPCRQVAKLVGPGPRSRRVRRARRGRTSRTRVVLSSGIGRAASCRVRRARSSRRRNTSCRSGRRRPRSRRARDDRFTG